MFSLDPIVKSLTDALLVIADLFIRFFQWLSALFGLDSEQPPSPESRERILRAWITILLFSIVAVILVENEFLNLIVLQRKVSLLKDLNEIANNGVKSNSELEPIYNDLVQQFTHGKVNTVNSYSSIILSSLNSFISTPLFEFKFLSGAALGLVLIIWALRMHAEKSEKLQTLRGALLVTLVFGVIGASLPLNLNNAAINLFRNFLILFGVQLVVLLFIGSRNRPSSETTN
jgi:hypothetical protein